MDADRLLIHLVAGGIFLLWGISAYGTFLKRRTRSNLAILLLPAFLLAGTILSLFLSASLTSISYRLVFHVLVATMFLVFVIRVNAIYYYRRTKYNLCLLIICILLFVVMVFNYFYPINLKFVGGTAAQILLAVVFIVFLALFLFYPYLSRYLSPRKMKRR